MRLTRNTTPDGRCKYALVRLDKLRKLPPETLMAQRAANALDELAACGLLEYAGKGDPEEAFTIKLKDENAAPALVNYAINVARKDPDFGREILEVAARSLSRTDLKHPD